MMRVPDFNPNPPQPRWDEDFEGHRCAGDDCDAEGDYELDATGEWYCQSCFLTTLMVAARRLDA